MIQWGTEAYNDFYAGQLTELMTNYGKIWECWWDGAGSDKAHYDWERWANIVRDKQPDAVIFGALGAAPYVDVRWVGNENGIAGDPCYAAVNTHDLEAEDCYWLNHGRLDGDRFVPAEADVSIRPGWFYHAEQDDAVRTPQNLLKLWFCSVARNTGLLLNLPPDQRGLLHENDIQSLLSFHKILTQYTAVNLAASAKVRASSIRNDHCTADMLLDANEESFYAPKDGRLTPTVEFSFEKPVTFNACIVSEMIEFGHKVRGFRVDALLDNGWNTVFSASCMGYRQGGHFEMVTARKVQLSIADAADVPAIRSFALYHFAEELFTEEIVNRSQKDLMKSSAAKAQQHNDEYVMDLGGIFPYNTIEFESDAAGTYQLYTFNGSSYEFQTEGPLCKGHNICIIKTVADSYKLILKTAANIEALSVFCR